MLTHDPDQVSTADDYLLAHSILSDARNALKFSTLAIPDGATGLGLALTELAAKVHVTTIVGAHDADEETQLQARGATHIVRRDLAELAEQVMRLTQSKGAEVIVDQVAGPRFAEQFGMIADFGNILVTAWRDGDPPKLFETLWAALDRCPCVQLWTLDQYRANPERLRALEEAVAALLGSQARPRTQIGIR